MHQNNAITFDAAEALYLMSGISSDSHPARHPWKGIILRVGALAATRKSGLYAQHDLLESVPQPDAVIAPGYQQINVTIKDGSVVSGRVWTETDSHLSLLSLDSEGLWQVQKLSRNDISDVQKIPTSIMPPYQLPRLQRYDLMAFLMSMKSVGGVH